MTAFDADEVARFRVAVARIGRGVDRQVQVDGMSRTQLSVLSSLARLGPIGAGDLAHIEGLNPTMLSRLVGKLEARGLASRSPDPDDGRAVRLAATAEGKALHRRLRRERTVLFAERLEQIGGGHAAVLQAALPAMEALADAMFAPPAAPAATTPRRATAGAR